MILISIFAGFFVSVAVVAIAAKLGVKKAVDLKNKVLDLIGW